MPLSPLNVTAESYSGEVIISWDYDENLNGVSFSIQHYEPEGAESSLLDIRSYKTHEYVNIVNESSQEKMIIGGEKAEIENNSHIVALLTPGVTDATEARFCAGSLIAPTWVITAAHCVDGGKNSSNIEISTGIADLSTVQQQDRLNVKTIHIHEGYLTLSLIHI